RGNRRSADLADARAAGFGARNHRADPEQHGDDGRSLGAGDLLAHAREVPAGNMAGLVREDPDELVWGLAFHQRADIHENPPAVRHERVEYPVGDDDDPDALLAEPGRPEDRLGIIAQQLL